MEPAPLTVSEGLIVTRAIADTESSLWFSFGAVNDHPHVFGGSRPFRLDANQHTRDTSGKTHLLMFD